MHSTQQYAALAVDMSLAAASAAAAIESEEGVLLERVPKIFVFMCVTPCGGQQCNDDATFSWFSTHLKCPYPGVDPVEPQMHSV